MNTRITLALLAFFIVIASGYAISTRDQSLQRALPAQTAATVAEAVAGVETGAGDSARPAAVSGLQAEGSDVAQESTDEVINIEAALAPRALGNPDAPVKIEEFASLTCSHCAHFYKDTFPVLKEKYIDTGKVYFVYTDFPLNAPALEASMVARCMPEDNYFRYIKFLFETQDAWAYERQYRNYLRENAKLLGMNDQTLDSCLGNEALKNGLSANMEAVSGKYNIKSTPTFVINDGAQSITGAQPLEVFEGALASLLEKSEQTE